MERIDHWIVLMFENRSFDNLLGYLPHIDAGTVIRDLFHADAVLATMRERFGLGPALTHRDAAAPLLGPAFNLSDPRRDVLCRIELPSWPAPGEPTEISVSPGMRLFRPV